MAIIMLSFEEDEKNDSERTWIRKESLGRESFDGEDFSETKILLRKTLEVAPDRSLGWSEIAKEGGVNVHRTILGFCDACGDKLEEKIVVCRLDGKKVCPGCAIKLDERKICPDCLRAKRPLSKHEYEVLLCYAKGLSRREIHAFTKIPVKEIKRAEVFLCDSEYVAKRLLKGFKISATGLDLLLAYGQVYKDEQIVNMKMEIENFIGSTR